MGKTEDISKDDYIRLPEFTLNNARKFYDFTLKICLRNKIKELDIENMLECLWIIISDIYWGIT